jgi:cytochrome c553
MQFRVTLLLSLGLTLSALAGSAQAEGDAARGKTLAYTCHGCHGIPDYKNAAPMYSVPKLGGQQSAYMVAALKEYASGDRAHPTMHAHAASNSEQDRADMVAFFAGKGARSAPVVGTPPPAAQVCTTCHGSDGKPVGPEYPNLSGQHADYLVQALRDYKSGKRKNAIMSGMVGNLKESDMEAIASFYSKQSGLCDTKQILNNDGQCKN